MRDVSAWLWGVALLALPFQRVPLPGPFGDALQPAEIASLPLLSLAAVLWVRGRVSWRASPVDLGVLAWLAGTAAAGSAFFVREARLDSTVLRECAVAAYLGLLYVSIRLTATEAALAAFPRLLAGSVGLASALGIAGTLASLAGLETPLAFPAATAYPYLGRAARARAFAATPVMLASLQTMALLLLAHAWGERTPRPWLRRALGALLAVGFALTFSKTVLCLAAALLVASLARRRGSGGARRAMGTLAVVLALAFGFALASHFVVVGERADRKALEDGMFIAGEPLASFTAGSRSFAVFGSNYLFNKEASLAAIRRTWPWGVGPGRQPAFAGELQREGRYPRTLWLGAPHSSYLGAASESGLPGVIGLGVFLGALGLGVARLGGSGEGGSRLGPAAAGAFAALLIEAIATDVMHFRHYWWLAALVAGSAARRPR